MRDHPNDGAGAGPDGERGSSADWTGDEVRRREFLKRAVAVGGAGALAACVERGETPDVARGPSDLAALPERQFAWNDYLPRDSHGNTKLPFHQLLVFFDYVGDGVPTEAEREQVEAALSSIDRAYQRGNGGENPYRTGTSVPGLLSVLGYGPSYFERFDASLPAEVDLQAPADVLEAVEEPTDVADDYDAVLLLASDHAQVLLSVEQALAGTLEAVNGVAIEGSFDGVFETVERRSGFVGAGVPRRKLDRPEISPKSPLSMGFKSGFVGNQASEGAVAIPDGPFADGATLQVSRLEIDLDAWYDRSKGRRVDLMFSPDHTEDDVGDVGEFLASDSGLTRDVVDDLEGHAEREGVVGHTQKVGRARTEEFEPRILRRSESVATGGESPGFNFTSVQRGLEDFVKTRKAMNFDHDDVADADNGILGFIETTSRATFLLPPRTRRALPEPS